MTFQKVINIGVTCVHTQTWVQHRPLLRIRSPLFTTPQHHHSSPGALLCRTVCLQCLLLPFLLRGPRSIIFFKSHFNCLLLDEFLIFSPISSLEIIFLSSGLILFPLNANGCQKSQRSLAFYFFCAII